MSEAALILSVIALILSIVSLTYNLAKHFSTHNVQLVPMKTPFDDGNPLEMGKSILDQFREIGDPIDDEELEKFKALKKAKK